MEAFIKTSSWIAGVLFFYMAMLAHSFHSWLNLPRKVDGIHKIIIDYFYSIELFIFVALILIFRRSERIVFSWIMIQNFICLFILIDGLTYHVFAVSHPSMQH